VKGSRTKKIERGAAYLWVVYVTLVVISLAFLFLSLAVTDRQVTSSYIDGIRAYYLAESGVEHSLTVLLYGSGQTGGILDCMGPDDLPAPEIAEVEADRPFEDDSKPPDYDYNLPHGYKVDVEREDYDSERNNPYSIYTITSTGVFNNSRKQVIVRLKVPFTKIECGDGKDVSKIAYSRCTLEYLEWRNLEWKGKEN